MNKQDRETFERWSDRHLNQTAERITLSCGTDAYRDSNVDYAFMGFGAALAHRDQQIRELVEAVEAAWDAEESSDGVRAHSLLANAVTLAQQLKEQDDE